jgi:hypothetical protein
MTYYKQIEEITKKYNLSEVRLSNVIENAFRIFKEDALICLYSEEKYRLDHTLGIVTDCFDQDAILTRAVGLRVYTPFEFDHDFIAVRQRVMDKLTEWFLEEVEGQAAHSPRFNQWHRKYVLFRRSYVHPWMIRLKWKLYGPYWRVRNLIMRLIVRPLRKCSQIFSRKIVPPAAIFFLDTDYFNNGSQDQEQQENKLIQ